MAMANHGSPGMRFLPVALLFALAGLLVVDLEPSASPRPAAAAAATRAPVAPVQPVPETVKVAFVRNGRFVRVERTVPKRVQPELHALRELLQGPTSVERRQGLRSAFRPGVRLRCAWYQAGFTLT